MKIVLRKEKCIGCGSCVSVAPDIFELKDGIVNLKKEPDLTDPKILGQVKLAASLCPTSVIEVVEE
ncbi:ferredoxin [Patescibacteria group bacterium]|nr:ferredoxin [Patescibacteria group bacterium]